MDEGYKIIYWNLKLATQRAKLLDQGVEKGQLKLKEKKKQKNKKQKYF